MVRASVGRVERRLSQRSAAVALITLTCDMLMIFLAPVNHRLGIPLPPVDRHVPQANQKAACH